MRKFVVLLVCVLFVTGCQVVMVNNKDYDTIIDTVLNKKMKLSNVSYEGYKFYLPRGMSVVNKLDSNMKLSYHSYNFYLYVDVTRYYHKSDVAYELPKDAYYSKELNYNGKMGYVIINKSSDVYFLEVMYNYAKIEAFVPLKELKSALIYSCYVLSSIDFNDPVLDTLIGENVLDYKEENFSVLKPKKDTQSFLDYETEYDDHSADLKQNDKVIDEDEIDISETE